MRYRSRRRIDVLLLTVGGLALAAAAAVSALVGNGERITGYWMLARVDGDDPVAITEVIDYEFGGFSRHGIYRDIDDLDPAAPVEVSSPTAPDQVQVQAVSPTRSRIRIGDPLQTVSGRHRYRIDYPLDLPRPGGQLAWDAVGNEWTVDIADLEIHVLGTAEFTDTECASGSFGSWGGCTVDQPEPGHLVVRIDDLDAGDGVTLYATSAAGSTVAPTAPVPPSGPVAAGPGTGLLVPAATALVAGIVGAAAASRLVRNRGRELVWAGGVADAAFGPQFGQDFPTRLVDHEELAELANIEFAPPRGLTSWEGGILHREGVDRDHQVAWLLERAADGQIAFSGVTTNRRNEVKGTVVLHRTEVPAAAEDETSLRALFGGRPSVSLGKYDKQFAAGWSKLGQRFDTWQRQAPFWDPNGDRRMKEARWAGAGSLVIGLAALVVAAGLSNRFGWIWLPGVALGAALAGAGLALLVRSWELRVRTPEGSGLWILTESFRRFIEQSDAQHVEAAARDGHLREYTAWATALGEADHWADVVGQADLDESVEPMLVTHALMASHLSSATSRAATAPSSSGGGGGGGVGGGGGGGGGGSW